MTSAQVDAFNEMEENLATDGHDVFSGFTQAEGTVDSSTSLSSWKMLKDVKSFCYTSPTFLVNMLRVTFSHHFPILNVDYRSYCINTVNPTSLEFSRCFEVLFRQCHSVQMSHGCHSEQLDEVEALKAIYDEVEILCDDEGLVALVVYIHPELPEGKVVIQADVNPAEVPEASEGYGLNPGASPSPSSTDIMELAKRKVVGGDLPKAPPALTRSESGRASRAEAEVSHLPPLRLHLNLPPDYPESSAPEFQLASSWLDSAILSELCRSLDQKWQEAEGSPIIFTWAEALRYEVSEAFHFQSSAKPPALLLHVDPDPGADRRARAECENAMESLLDLVLYDKRRALDLWKQQQQLCNICFSEYPGSQFVHLGECPHAFCRSCVTVMAELHVTEGSISELLCPEPSCRAEISAFALGEVLDEQRYERWHSLKLQRVLMSELKGVVFCPRCEEGGRQMPVLPDQDDSDGVPPVARCTRCEYVFCAKCLGLYHGRDPCLHPEERAQQAAMRRLENSQGAAEKRKLKREAEKGYLVCVNLGDELPWIDAAGYITEDQEPNMLEGDYVWAVHAGVPERITGSTLWDKQRDNICSLAEVLKDAPRRGLKRVKGSQHGFSSWSFYVLLT